MSHPKQWTVWKSVCSCFAPVWNHMNFPPCYITFSLLLKLPDTALEGPVMSVCSGTDGFVGRTAKMLVARMYTWMKWKMSLMTLPQAETQQSTAHASFLPAFFLFWGFLFLSGLSSFPLNVPSVPNYLPSLPLTCLAHITLFHSPGPQMLSPLQPQWSVSHWPTDPFPAQPSRKQGSPP